MSAARRPAAASSGLTPACAQIWTANAAYDTKPCGGTCFLNWFTPYNVNPPTCELNVCLACDETTAGPVFQRVAGRTRRRSGLQAAITRPCATQAHIVHTECPH